MKKIIAINLIVVVMLAICGLFFLLSPNKDLDENISRAGTATYHYTMRTYWVNDPNLNGSEYDLGEPNKPYQNSLGEKYDAGWISFDADVTAADDGCSYTGNTSYLKYTSSGNDAIVELSSKVEWPLVEKIVTYDVTVDAKPLSGFRMYTVNHYLGLRREQKEFPTTLKLNASNFTTSEKVMHSETQLLHSSGWWTDDDYYWGFYVVFAPCQYQVTFDANGGKIGSNSSTKITQTYLEPYIFPEDPVKEGYEFQGWYTAKTDGEQITTDNTIATSDDHTLYAIWEPKTTSITLDRNDGSGGPSSVTATYDSAMPKLSSVPTKTGYTFNGYYINESNDNGTDTKYYNSNGTSARNWDIDATTDTLYAGWTIESYTINYDANGGSVSPASDTVNYNERITLPTPTRAGYTFNGWRYGGTNYTSSYTVPDFGASGTEVTFEAQWTKESYTIKYDANGGTATRTSDDVDYGQSITLPSATRAGYTFNGWRYGGTNYTGSYTVPDFGNNGATVTFTAQWTIESYTIKYDANGGTATRTSDDVDYGQSITLPSATRTGYTFNGWRYNSTNYTGSYTVPDFGDNGATVTFTAQWTKESYTIKYDANGGSVSPNSQTVNYGDSITLPTPTRAGYTFNGWRYNNTNYTGSYTVPDFGNNGATVTFTAQWTKESYTIKYDANGGSVSPTSDSVNYGERITLPTPTRTGYTFNGWRYGGTNYTGSYTVPDFGDNGATVTFTAQWTAKTYNNTFNANGGKFSDGATTKSFTMRYNTQDYSMLETYIPTQAGYTFAGWYDSSNTQVYNSQGQSIAGTRYFNSSRNWIYDGTVTFYAHWSANRYTVTFDEDGGNSVSDISNYTIESTITFPSTTKAGYDFVNWQVTRADGNWTNGASFNANTTTTDKYGNVTLTAQWDYHTYTVTLDPNGGEVSPTSIRVTYQSTYGSLPTPTRDGYVFKGWYTSETSGTQILSTTKYTSTQDTTIFAQWQDTWANHASDALTSEDGYYLVSSEEDLARVSYLLNCTTRTDVQTMKFKLTKNLDMSDYRWLPIGSQSRQFRGTFDGNGYIISGLNTYYNSSIASTYTNIGLFGYVNGATIQNLYLRDTDMRGGSNVGGLIGYATGNTQVTSCAFDGSITANSNGGSIVGLGATSVIVSNCTVFSSNTTADTNGMARGCSVRSLVYITNDTKGYIGTDFSNYVFVEGMPAPVPTGLSWLAQGGEPCDNTKLDSWANGD